MQTIHNELTLRNALCELEGSGGAANWDGEGTLTLSDAIRQYKLAQPTLSAEADDYNVYATIYGNGGVHRYYLNLRTGEVTFSGHHAGANGMAKALSLGFNMH